MIKRYAKKIVKNASTVFLFVYQYNFPCLQSTPTSNKSLMFIFCIHVKLLQPAFAPRKVQNLAILYQCL